MSDTVRLMFAEISERYDLTNNIITFGLHKNWKRRLVEYSAAKGGDRVLDCASGTGDVAIEFKKNVGEQGEIIASDFCQEMLDIAESKISKLGLRIDTTIADAMNLQFVSSSFDIVSISYGIRNVDDPLVALSEMARVTKNGGCLAILETGQPKGIIGIMHSLFLKVIPGLGALFTRNKHAYQYLPKTAKVFPSGEDFASLLKKTPFISDIKTYPLLFGASYIYIARVTKD